MRSAQYQPGSSRLRGRLARAGRESGHETTPRSIETPDRLEAVFTRDVCVFEQPQLLLPMNGYRKGVV